MTFCPVVPEICRGQIHGARKERRIIKIRIIIIIITRYDYNLTIMKSPKPATDTIYPHIKCWWYRTMLNFYPPFLCLVLAAILKMADILKIVCLYHYKIVKSPTPEGKISIVLFTRLAELENDCNLTQGCRRFPYLVLFPVFDFISH